MHKLSEVKKPKKGQEEIFSAILKKDWATVWVKVQYIGIDKERNPNVRKLIFLKACAKFDPTKNDNFCGFYYKQLSFYYTDKCTKDRRFSLNSTKKQNCQNYLAGEKIAKLSPQEVMYLKFHRS